MIAREIVCLKFRHNVLIQSLPSLRVLLIEQRHEWNQVPTEAAREARPRQLQSSLRILRRDNRRQVHFEIRFGLNIPVSARVPERHTRLSQRCESQLCIVSSDAGNEFLSRLLEARNLLIAFDVSEISFRNSRRQQRHCRIEKRAG